MKRSEMKLNVLILASSPAPPQPPAVSVIPHLSKLRAGPGFLLPLQLRKKLVLGIITEL